MADTQQGRRQKIARGAVGTLETYDGDLRALFESGAFVPAGSTFNEAFILWLQEETGSSSNNVNDLAALYASQQPDTYNWSSVGPLGDTVMPTGNQVAGWDASSGVVIPDSSTFVTGEPQTLLTTDDEVNFWFQDALTGETPFHGLRRIQNLNTVPFNDWTEANGATIDDNILTFPADADATIGTAYASILPRRSCVFLLSVRIRLVSGDPSFRLQINHGGTQTHQSNDIQCSSEFQIFQFQAQFSNAVGTSVTPFIGNSSNAAPGVFEISDVQLENRRGMGTNQVFGDWVDAATLYNAGAFGVRVFSKTNANTITDLGGNAGRVIQTTGATIVNGGVSLWPEETTNEIDDQDISSWTQLDNVTITNNGTNVVGLTEYQISCDDVNDGHRALQVVSTGSAGSAQVIAREGTLRFMIIRRGDSVPDDYACFDLQTGAVTEQGSGIDFAASKDLSNGVFSCRVRAPSSSTAFHISPSDTGTPGVSNPTFQGNDDTIFVCYSEFLDNEYSGPTPIITDGTIVTKTASLFSDINWPGQAWAEADVTVAPSITTQMNILGLGTLATDYFGVDAPADITLNLGSFNESATAVDPYEDERHKFSMTFNQEYASVADDENNTSSSSVGPIYVGSVSDGTGQPFVLHSYAVYDDAVGLTDLKESTGAEP